MFSRKKEFQSISTEIENKGLIGTSSVDSTHVLSNAITFIFFISSTQIIGNLPCTNLDQVLKLREYQSALTYMVTCGHLL